jgi:hypothetical protein
MSTIIFNNRDAYALDWLSDPTNPKAQRLFGRHYQSPVRPKCNCLVDGRSRDLVIKKRNRFFLAKIPGTGDNHSPWCDLHGTTPTDATRPDGKIPAIIEIGDKLDINLSSYMELPTLNESLNLANRPNVHSGNGSGRNSVTLLGLLQFLWQKSNLHIWFPNRNFPRNFNTVQKSIDGLASLICIRKRRLANLLVMPIWRKGIDRAKNLELNRQNLFKQTSKSGQAGVIIGMVNRWIPSKTGDGSVGLGFDLLDKLLWISPETATTVEQSYAQLIKEIRQDDRQIVAIATVFRNGDYCTISDIALMRTNTQFIPVDSSYELLVANKLIAENRKFRKPLRLERERYLPDFVLMDCVTDVVMEVFGVQGNIEYDERKTEKLADYQEKQITCWHWIPNEQRVMPDFPSVAQTRP